MSARYQVVYKKMLKQTPTLDDLASFSPSLCDPQRASHIRFFAALLEPGCIRSRKPSVCLGWQPARALGASELRRRRCRGRLWANISGALCKPFPRCSAAHPLDLGRHNTPPMKRELRTNGGGLGIAPSWRHLGATRDRQCLRDRVGLVLGCDGHRAILLLVRCGVLHAPVALTPLTHRRPAPACRWAGRRSV
jgi:hypothetical protein